MPTFPYIVALVRHGRSAAWTAAILLALIAAYGAWRLSSPELAVLGLIFAGVAYLGMRLLAEIVQAIAETLLPR